LGLARSTLDSHFNGARAARRAQYVYQRDPRYRARRLWSALSFVLIALSFATDRLFTNKVQIRTLQMSYSLDGKTPWRTTRSAMLTAIHQS